MPDLAKAYVQIIPSADGMKQRLTEIIGDEMPSGEETGKGFGSSLASAIKSAIVAAGIGETLKKAITEGMELEQNLGGTEAVFGEFAQGIQQSAAEAYKNMGLSASDYMATANKMGSLFQGSGLEQQRALDLTSKAMQRAADVASVMGIDTSMAMESIAGAAKGNFTMMDNLGVAMNATTLEAYALEKGMNFEWKTASNAEKAELAMQMFFERTEQYAGNFARESEETLSGSMGAVKAIFQDTLGNLTLGNDIGPSLEALKEALVTFVGGNLLPAFGNILKGLPEIVTSLVPDLINSGVTAAIGLMEGLTSGLAQNVTAFLDQALPMLMSFSGALRENAGQLVDAGLNLILELGNGLIAGLPTMIQTIPTIVSNIAGIINDNAPKLLATAATLIWNLASGLIQSIPLLLQEAPKIIGAIADVITAFNWVNLGKTIVTGIQNAVKKLPGELKSLVQKAVANIKNAFSNGGIPGVASKIINSVKSLFTSGFNAVKNTVSNVINGIKNIISNGLNGAKNVVTNILNAIKSKFTGIFNGVKSIVSGAIRKIKGIMNFSWSLPKLKLPHVTIKGKFSLSPPSVPTFGISWYKKAMSNAMLLNSPTIFGMSGNTFLGAGDAGLEVVAGANTLMGMMRTAVGGSLSSGLEQVNDNFERLFAILGQYYPQFASCGVYLDGDRMVGQMAPAMDRALGRLEQQRGRGR